MRVSVRAVWLVIGTVMAAQAEAQTAPQVLHVWPGNGGAAEDDTTGIPSTEKIIFPFQTEDKQNYVIGGQPVTAVSDVTKPTLLIYRPVAEKDTGAAVVICPGGGYWNLCIDLEGEEVARWLTDLGVTGIILKYRVPRRKNEPDEFEPPTTLGPLKDAQRAISLVRFKAQKNDWGKQCIDPQRIGMIGFSAGGHLVAQTATNFDTRSYQRIDDIDDVDRRPDFGILCYPGPCRERFADQLHHSLKARPDAPPLFVVVTGDDRYECWSHCTIFYLAMRRAKAPVELAIYQTGGHGFAVRNTHNPVDHWRETCVDWMQFRGFLAPKKRM